MLLRQRVQRGAFRRREQPRGDPGAKRVRGLRHSRSQPTRTPCAIANNARPLECDRLKMQVWVIGQKRPPIGIFHDAQGKGRPVDFSGQQRAQLAAPRDVAVAVAREPENGSPDSALPGRAGHSTPPVLQVPRRNRTAPARRHPVRANPPRPAPPRSCRRRDPSRGQCCLDRARKCLAKTSALGGSVIVPCEPGMSCVASGRRRRSPSPAACRARRGVGGLEQRNRAFIRAGA